MTFDQQIVLALLVLPLVGAIVVWILGLSRVPVSVAYPMLSVGYIVNAILAWWLFGESITASCARQSAGTRPAGPGTDASVGRQSGGASAGPSISSPVR